MFWRFDWGGDNHQFRTSTLYFPQNFLNVALMPVFFSELFAMGPVQFSLPTEWPKISLLNQDLGNI